MLRDGVEIRVRIEHRRPDQRDLPQHRQSLHRIDGAVGVLVIRPENQQPPFAGLAQRLRQRFDLAIDADAHDKHVAAGHGRVVGEGQDRRIGGGQRVPDRRHVLAEQRADDHVHPLLLRVGGGGGGAGNRAARIHRHQFERGLLAFEKSDGRRVHELLTDGRIVAGQWRQHRHAHGTGRRRRRAAGRGGCRGGAR